MVVSECVINDGFAIFSLVLRSAGMAIHSAVSTKDIRHSHGRLPACRWQLTVWSFVGVVSCVLVATSPFWRGTPLNERGIPLCVGVTGLLNLPACGNVEFQITMTPGQRYGAAYDAFRATRWMPPPSIELPTDVAAMNRDFENRNPNTTAFSGSQEAGPTAM